LGAGIEKLPMQLAERVRVLDGHLRRELAAPATRADLLASGPAVDIAAALEFQQISAVADDDAVLEQFRKEFHQTAIPSK
jgi:hypothetical protein